MLGAGYIEDPQTCKAKPTVEQHLAAVRMLFDWLVVGHVVAANPATSVRGPKHIVHKGMMPVLTLAAALRPTCCRLSSVEDAGREPQVRTKVGSNASLTLPPAPRAPARLGGGHMRRRSLRGVVRGLFLVCAATMSHS